MRYFFSILLGFTIAFSAKAAIRMPSVDSVLLSPNIYFSSIDTAYLYSAKIDAYSYHFSGIMLIKKSKTNEYRCVFTTETGFKLFDLLIQNDKAKVDYVMKEMNNPIFLKLIKEDILLMLQLKPKVSPKNGRVSIPKAQNAIIERGKGIFYSFVNTKLVAIQKGSIEKISLEIQFDEINQWQKANIINIEHKNIPVKVSLKAFYNAIVEE